MARPEVDPAQAAAVLAAAHFLGDEAAAAAAGITTRTVRRHRRRAARDPELSAVVRTASAQMAETLRSRLVRSVGLTLTRLDAMVAAAPPEAIKDVAIALKVQGELAVVAVELELDEPLLADEDADAQAPQLSARKPDALDVDPEPL